MLVLSLPIIYRTIPNLDLRSQLVDKFRVRLINGIVPFDDGGTHDLEFGSEAVHYMHLKDIWAAYVFDRLDFNRLKMMQIPNVLYDYFADFEKSYGFLAGSSKGGHDWAIRTECASTKHMRIGAIALDDVKFTEKEIKVIQTIQTAEAIDRLRGIKTKGCQHQFINVGFSSIKMVCKHCDMEQK